MSEEEVKTLAEEDETLSVLPPPPPSAATQASEQRGQQVGIEVADIEMLSRLSKETTDRLGEIWAEMGLSKSERARQLEVLVDQVKEVFSSKLADEVALRDEYASAAASLQDEINSLSFNIQVEAEKMPPCEGVDLMRKLTWLRGELDRLFSIKKSRLEKLEALQAELFHVWDELGEEYDLDFTEFGEQITLDKLDSFEARLVVVRHEKEQRIEALELTCKDVTNLFDELEYEITDDFDIQIAQGGKDLGITMKTVQRVSLRARELTDEKISRTERLKQLGSQIQPLWDLLNVPTEERQKFFMENRGLGLHVIAQCELELERLLNLKQEKIEQLIEQARGRIGELFDQMLYAPSQRERYDQVLHSSEYGDELLDQHTEIITKLEAQLEQLQPILKCVEKYDQLCEEREDYEVRIQDSTRLLSRKRGASQLREEELQRKRVTQQLPRLVEKLKATVATYEEEHGDLVLNGQRFLESLEQKEDDYAARKREEKERKLKAKRDGTNTTTGTPRKGTLPRKASKPKVNSTANAENQQRNHEVSD